MKFILLGSGAVRPDLERWGPAQLIQVGGENLLFDCGRGASMRLVQAGIPLESICRVFFTHHHFDHNCDFAYLFLTSWLLGRNVPMQIVGPRGTREVCDGLFRCVYLADIMTRRGHPLYGEHGEEYCVHEITENSAVFETPTYRIRIVHVSHRAPILDNLAYRVEADGKSIVVVGDTVLDRNLMELAQGTDLLVHECSFPSTILKRERWEAFHTAPRELGKWARESGVKQLLLKHFCLRPGLVTIEELVNEVKETYGDQGLIIGRDLLSLEI
ncbi:MAG: MBL fold metallo-hydrolase [Kiritimatiellae bacterium]|nr:MBL fold metallo-hydrolase [Kiritimatiellia bacterium]